MAFMEMPIRNDIQSYNYKLTLDEEQYGVSFRFNSRYGKWIFDLYDSEGAPIILGRPILTNVNPFERFVSEKLPPGLFICLDLTYSQLDPDADSFSKTTKYYYVEAA